MCGRFDGLAANPHGKLRTKVSKGILMIHELAQDYGGVDLHRTEGKIFKPHDYGPVAEEDCHTTVPHLEFQGEDCAVGHIDRADGEGGLHPCEIENRQIEDAFHLKAKSVETDGLAVQPAHGHGRNIKRQDAAPSERFQEAV